MSRPRTSTDTTQETKDSDDSFAVSGINSSTDESSDKVSHETTNLGSWKDSLRSILSDESNSNTKAVAIAHIPRAAAFCSLSVYFSGAMVRIATQAAGCETDPLPGESTVQPCMKKIFGLKPSSMLSLYILILGIVVSIFLPTLGAMLDSSNYRRGVGRVVSLLITIITCILSFISKGNWIFMMILQIFNSLLLEVEYCIILAYIPGLTNDENQMTQFNVLFATIFNCTVLLFLIGMTVASFFLWNDVKDQPLVVARVAMTVTLIMQIIFYGYAWSRLFGPIQASDESNLNNKGRNKSTICSGLKRVGKTLCEIFQQKREIKWFLFSRSIVQAANIGFIAALLSYLSDTVNISPRDLGIATLILLAAAIPGNQISMPLSRWMKPLRSLQCCLFFWTIFGASISFLVYQPGHEPRLFGLAIGLGFTIGWKEPTDKTIWCQLVPTTKSAEMMGLYLFFSQILTWLPPLVFTFVNEISSIRVALSSFAGYFMIGIILLWFMGNALGTNEGRVVEGISDEEVGNEKE